MFQKDPEDAKNVEVEIRAGTGGDEAALFAGDLFQMYKKYCDSMGWGISITNESEGTMGGFKEIAFSVTGANVYGILKYESGSTSCTTSSCYRNTRKNAYFCSNSCCST